MAKRKIKVIIERSDGIRQSYNISRENLANYQKLKAIIEFNGSKRSRTYYSSKEKTIEQKAEKQKPIPSSNKRYNGVFYNDVYHAGLTKVKEVSTNRPIPDLKGQVRVKLKGWKRTSSKVVEGRSFKDNMDSFHAIEIAKGEAYSQAFAQFTFSPDGVNVLKIDFVYFIPINA